MGVLKVSGVVGVWKVPERCLEEGWRVLEGVWKWEEVIHRFKQYMYHHKTNDIPQHLPHGLGESIQHHIIT